MEEEHKLYNECNVLIFKVAASAISIYKMLTYLQTY